MIKPKTFECFDGAEAGEEIGSWWYDCWFAKDMPYRGYAVLHCDDESLEAWEVDLNEWPDDSEKTINEIAWVKYFRSLGYRDQVVINLT